MIDEKHRHEIAEAMRRCNQKAFGWPMGLAAAIAQASDGGQDPLHELADLIDRPTCNDVGDGWTFHCSACGCELDIEDREGEPTMWLGESVMTPRHCPNCGAVVIEKEEDNG